ncbi:MAG: HD domain-containing protein [Anaerolineales bacterium]|nr:HD domain-containing protein [Anaerolineales bacterium]
MTRTGTAVRGDSNSAPPPRWRQVLGRIPTALLVFGAMLAAAAILTLPILPGQQTVSLELGDVAAADVVAPRSVTYVSESLTRQARTQAAAAVAPVYDPPDPLIAREQAEKLQAAITFIANVRSDPYSTFEEKLSDLAQLSQVQLSSETAARILQLNDIDWEQVQQEAKAVLERIMRQPIGPSQLEEIVESIPNYVSLSLPETQIALVSELVRNLVVPNSLYNAEATEALREDASANTEAVTRSFVTGQVVIARGRVVTEADLEAVFMLGLTTEALNLRTTASMAIAAALFTVLLSVFVAQFHPEIARRARLVFLFCLILLAFLATARIMVPDHAVLPFLFPVSALGILIACLFGRGLGILSAMVLSTFAGWLGNNQLEIALFGGLSGLTAVLLVGKGEKPLQFFSAGLAVGMTGSFVVVITRLSEPASDLIGILTLIACSFANGLISSILSLGLLFLIGILFDIPTNLQLLELSRPDHPLLREILLQAPGTYQHSLQVANLAEYAGERIGSNTLLLRVGALYHDAGKALHPDFFVENQAAEGNPHDLLDPESSARLIIQHARDGLALGRKHRLPTRVRDLIAEHHGTLRTSYQYGLALKAAGGKAQDVDEEKYRYPGPRPQSKEAAILMLADGVEAKYRALMPTAPEDVEKLVRDVLDDRIAQRQFDDTDLTLRDLETIRKAFIDALRGRAHSRLLYPEDEKKTQARPARPKR